MSQRPGGIGEAIRSVESARLISELREQFDKRQYIDISSLRRSEVIEILKDIRSSLDRGLEDRSYTFGITVHKRHPAVAILDYHIDALQDLDNGKVHEFLRPSSTWRGAALTAEQKRQDIQLVNAVTVVQSWKGFATRREAEEYVAAGCRKAGKRRKGKEITAKMLKNLRDHLKR